MKHLRAIMNFDRNDVDAEITDKDLAQLKAIYLLHEEHE